jgi:hypothetical protein
MSTEITEFRCQYRALIDRLAETEKGEGELSAKWAQCSGHCLEVLRHLRKPIADQGFPDRDTEIYFFKHIKPAIVGRHRYYKRIYQLHLGELKGCWSREKERLRLQQDALVKFREEHKSLWQYYQSGGTALDAAYFLRENYDLLDMPLSTGYDEIFCTCGDGLLAELIGIELQLQYIEGLLKAGEQDVNKNQPPTTIQLTWTDTTTSIVELGYSLYARKCFNGGRASIKEVMGFLSELLKVDLVRYYDTFSQVRERKMNPTKFLDELKNSLLKYMDDLDDK